jgi:CBS domain-containing protein
VKISEAMTSIVETIQPDDTAQYAASRMKEHDVGFLPVVVEGQAVGVLTDRDLALRCCAEGRDPHATRVGDLMTPGVIGCRETEGIASASRLMEEKKLRRIVVTDDAGVVTGLLSVDDLAARMNDPGVFSRVLRQAGLTTTSPAGS